MDSNTAPSPGEEETSQRPQSHPGTAVGGFLMIKNKIKASFTNLSARLTHIDPPAYLTTATAAAISSTDPEIIAMASSENDQMVVSIEDDASVALNLTTMKEEVVEKKTDENFTHRSSEEAVVVSVGGITPTKSTITTATASQQPPQQQQQQQLSKHSVHPISKDTQEIIDLLEKLEAGKTTINYKPTSPVGFHDPDPECNEFLASLSPEDCAITMGLPPPGRSTNTPTVSLASSSAGAGPSSNMDKNNGKKEKKRAEGTKV
ncbi:hypothetical protein TWF694_002292 [Orbilia ellipsospora]|uniref:Uncharacterized protein n=1 Tax=Orbilia ellipsospora TaxID=2528407 RepID=A0AAV9X2T5_9PEZI